MMYGFGIASGWWLPMMGMMLIFWVAVILLVIWAVRGLFPQQQKPFLPPQQRETVETLETLRQRFARGEISAADYEYARARLEDIPAA